MQRKSATAATGTHQKRDTRAGLAAITATSPSAIAAPCNPPMGISALTARLNCPSDVLSDVLVLLAALDDARILPRRTVSTITECCLPSATTTAA